MFCARLIIQLINNKQQTLLNLKFCPWLKIKRISVRMEMGECRTSPGCLALPLPGRHPCCCQAISPRLARSSSLLLPGCLVLPLPGCHPCRNHAALPCLAVASCYLIRPSCLALPLPGYYLCLTKSPGLILSMVDE